MTTKNLEQARLSIDDDRRAIRRARQQIRDAQRVTAHAREQMQILKSLARRRRRPL